MKTFTHLKGYKAEQYTRPNGDKVYKVLTKGGNKIIDMLYENELLDFGFVEDKQEDLIDKAIDDILALQGAYDAREKIKQAILNHLPHQS